MAFKSSAVRPSPPASPDTPTSPMQLDLSSLPPLISPAPPSNTLLITNLQDLALFTPPILDQIRTLLAEQAPLHSFAPLRAFRRIIVSFHTVDDAIRVRQHLDGAALLGHRTRVYFGEPTPTNMDPATRHLAAPAAPKLFFISPPPSPPAGWEMRNEEPPNTSVHADDLACALARLNAAAAHVTAPEDELDTRMDDVNKTSETANISTASTSASASAPIGAAPDSSGSPSNGSPTIVYHPADHGDCLSLPAVMVEDTGSSGSSRVNDVVSTALDVDPPVRVMAHTARPPVELC